VSAGTGAEAAPVPGAERPAGIAAARAANWRAGPRRVPAAIVFALLLLAPFFLEPVALGTLGRILYYALLAASLDLLVGITGLPSLAHAAYFAVGAYTAGLLGKHVTELAIVQIGAATLAAAVVAALTGWLAVRARGIFFLMLTLALGEIGFRIAEGSDFTGGSNGLYGIPSVQLLPGSPLVGAAPVYWYVLGVFAVGFAVLWTIARSPFGLALRGVRDNEERMRALGYATLRLKYGAYCAAGAIAGLAGSLLAAHQRLVTPADAAFGTAVLALVAVIIGGAGSLWGACVGAAVVVVIRDQIGPSLDGHGPLLLGVVFIACVYGLPQGIAGLRLRLPRLRRVGARP
jgi:branched-chain amino acid transport system permease protein